MPLPLPVWENTMKRVDKDSGRVKQSSVDHGYHIPKPAVLITGLTPECLQHFMTSWLTVRPLWISQLDHNPPHQFPSAQLWREFLHSIPPKDELLGAGPSSGQARTLTKSHKLATLEIFGETGAATIQGSSWAPKENVEWRERLIPIASLLNPPPRVIRAILWETYEIGFRYELRALDQVMVSHLWANHRDKRVSLLYCVFPGSAGLVMWKEPLPTKPGDLGLTDSFTDNMRVLRSLCFLLAAWPDAHPSFSAFASLVSVPKEPKDRQAEAYGVMSRATFFYVQTFFDHFGRPPLLPHAFPPEYHD